MATIERELDAAGVTLDSIDAFSGYCGGMGPTVGGIFAIDETVCEHVLNCGMNHPAILGAPILFSFEQKSSKIFLYNSTQRRKDTELLNFMQHLTQKLPSLRGRGWG